MKSASIVELLFGDPNWHIGEYEIVRLLAEGELSFVYKAIIRESSRPVVVKVLKPEAVSSGHDWQRQRDGQLASMLDHPNVVQTLAYGQRGGRAYIVMEYVEGETLRELIRRRRGLTSRMKIDILVQAARGLEKLHEAGLVHSDFCPNNILVTPEGVAKLIDFGLAMRKRDKAKWKWNRTETASYVAPEQVRGRQDDVRTDVYAFGVMMYELFTRRLPFQADDLEGVFHAHLNQRATRPRRMNPRIPADVESIILKAMSTERDCRYRQIGLLLNDFAEAIGRARVRREEKRREQLTVQRLATRARLPNQPVIPHDSMV